MSHSYKFSIVRVVLLVAALVTPSQSVLAKITPSITSVSHPVIVGDSFTISGSGFTSGSVVNFFVATGSGSINFGPLKQSGHTATTLTVPVPASKVTTLGEGVVSVMVVNSDQGFTESNIATAQLFGNNADGFPNLMTINGIALAATSTNPSFATDNVETKVVQGHTVTLGGNGFDTLHGVAIDLFCDCSGGKIKTMFVAPGTAGFTTTSLSFTLPAGAVTGPGAFVISNKGAKGDYAIKSNAVSVAIGAAVSITSVTQSACTVTVKGTGFAVTGSGLPPFTVINLFNKQGGTVVNLGGLDSGAPKIPLDVTSADQFTFSLSGTGVSSGPAYVQVLNPPFVPFSTSGNTPNGGFMAAACGPAPTPTPVSGAGLWIENSLNDTVNEFAGATLTTPGASVPSPAVSNKSANLIPDTSGLTFDASNNQWVAVCGDTKGNHGSIVEFNSTTVSKLSSNPSPAATIILSDDGTGHLISCPWAVTFRAGNLWAAISNEHQVTATSGYVTEYQPSQLGTSGHPTPFITLTDPTQFVSPTGVVFDSGGNLFVSDFGPAQFGKPGNGTIWVFKAATVGALTSGTNSIKATARLFDNTTVSPINGTFDSSGNLWVADCEANNTGEIYMFPKATLTSGASSASVVFQPTSIVTPNGTESTIDCPGGIAFDSAGNLWYTNFASNHVDGAIGEFAKSQLSTPGKSTPTPHIFLDGNVAGTNISQPIGLTFGPSS